MLKGVKFMADRSRMNREVHVRICEGLGVRFPRATRLKGIEASKNLRYIAVSAIGCDDFISISSSYKSGLNKN
jgi:hypothetical protein